MANTYEMIAQEYINNLLENHAFDTQIDFINYIDNIIRTKDKVFFTPSPLYEAKARVKENSDYVFQAYVQLKVNRYQDMWDDIISENWTCFDYCGKRQALKEISINMAFKMAILGE